MMVTQGALVHLFDVHRDLAERRNCTPRRGAHADATEYSADCGR